MGVIAGSTGSPNTIGTITYNGFSFSGPRVRWTIDGRPKPSKDGRTTLGNIYRLTLRYLMTDDPSGLQSHQSSITHAGQIINARSNVQKARALLTKSGGELTITGQGFNLSLNDGTSDSLFDPDFGPRCLSFRFRPIGDGIVWQLDWVLEWFLPECYNSDGTGHAGHVSGAVSGSSNPSYLGFPHTMGGLEGLVFSVNYTIDRAGLTTRIIEGSLSVALNRKISRADADPDNVFKITATADEARLIIEPPIPPEFQRISQEWPLSEDKRTLGFRIVDQEIPGENAMPPGVHLMELDHTVNTHGLALPSNTSINCNFRGYIEVLKGFALGDAFDRVILIMQQRIDVARNAFQAGPGDGDKNNVYITAISLTESLYGSRRVAFNVSYLINTPNTNFVFGNLIQRTGLFTHVDVPGVNFDEWGLSMADTAWHQRGIARREFQADQDRIVGPCDGTEGTYTSDRFNLIPLALGGGSLATDCPAEGYDYLGYDSDISLKSDSRTIINAPLKIPGTTTTESRVKGQDNAHLISGGYSNGQAYTSQRTASRTNVYITLSGTGARLGQPPEIPMIDAVDFNAGITNGTIVPIGEADIKHSRKGKLGTCSIFTVKWKIQYALVGGNLSDIPALVKKIEESTILTESDPDAKKAGGLQSTDGQ